MMTTTTEKWETVSYPDDERDEPLVLRLKVPNGWLYAVSYHGFSTTFVPEDGKTFPQLNR